MFKRPIASLAVLTLVAALFAATPTAEARPPQGWVDAQLPGTGFDMVADHDRQVLYVTIPNEQTIAVVRMTDGGIGVTYPSLPGDPYGIDLSPDGNSLLVALDSGLLWKLDLDLGSFETFDVAETLDSDLAFDVLALDDSRVLITGNPGSTGTSFVVLLDTATGTQSVVASNQIIRGAPRLAWAGPNSVLVTESFSPNSVQRLDITAPDMPIVAEDDHGSISGSYFATADQTGDRVYLPSQILDATDMSVLGEVPNEGVHIVSPDNTQLLTMGVRGIGVLDLATQQTDPMVIPSNCKLTAEQVQDAGTSFGYRSVPVKALTVDPQGNTLFTLYNGKVCADDLNFEAVKAFFTVRAPLEAIGPYAASGQIALLSIDSTGNAAGSLAIHQASRGIPGRAEADDFFGNYYAWGDLDGNGIDDLIVGTPGESIGSAIQAGAITVLYDAASGDYSRAQLLHQSSPGVPGRSESGDNWGIGLAAGDIDGDGYEDAIVGAPGEDIGRSEDAGAITVFYGGPAGLTTDGAQLIHQDSPGVPGRNETGDRFGFSIAVAGATPGSSMYVAVSSPYEDIGSRGIDLGSVTLFGTGSNGLEPQPNMLYPTAPAAGRRPAMDQMEAFTFDVFGLRLHGAPDGALTIGVPFASTAAATDVGYVMVYNGFDSTPRMHQFFGGSGDDAKFGFSIDAETINGIPALAIGAPDDSIADLITGTGVVTLIADYTSGPGAFRSAWHQDSEGVPGLAEENDFFGNYVDLDPSGALFVGAPGEDLGSRYIDVGAGTVFFFDSPFETTDIDIVSVHQGSPGVPGANESGDLWGL